MTALCIYFFSTKQSYGKHLKLDNKMFKLLPHLLRFLLFKKLIKNSWADFPSHF